MPALSATDILQPVSSAAADLLARFPPRPAAASWPAISEKSSAASVTVAASGPM